MNKGGLFITGTDTDVGKTLVTSLLGALLQARGFDIGLFKPVQTGVKNGLCPDLEVYRRFVSISDSESETIPLRFKAPQAPVIAAQMEKKHVQIEKMLRTFYILRKRHSNMLIEGIGGVEVPVDKKNTVLDLITRFELPAVVVARPGLGTINHTCLTVKSLRRAGVPVAGIVFSRVRARDKAVFRMVESEIVRLTRCRVLAKIPELDGRFSPARITGKATSWFDIGRIETYFIK